MEGKFSMGTSQTHVFSRTGSIGVDFFFDVDIDLHPIPDDIFKYSFSIWGGRFSLINPYQNEKSGPKWCRN